MENEINRAAIESYLRSNKKMLAALLRERRDTAEVSIIYKGKEVVLFRDLAVEALVKQVEKIEKVLN